MGTVAPEVAVAKWEKKNKKLNPFDAGNALAGEALGAFNQAIVQLERANQLLDTHALNSEEDARLVLEQAAQIMAEAKLDAEASRAEAAEARALADRNSAVANKLKDLMAV